MRNVKSVVAGHENRAPLRIRDRHRVSQQSECVEFNHVDAVRVRRGREHDAQIGVNHDRKRVRSCQADGADARKSRLVYFDDVV